MFHRKAIFAVIATATAAPAAAFGIDGTRTATPMTMFTTIADKRETSPLERLIPRSPSLPPAGSDLVAHPSVVTEDELEERARIRDEARWLFLRSSATSPDPDVHALEELFARYRIKKERTISGGWKLMVAYNGIAKNFNDLSNAPASTILRAHRVLDQWTEAYPKSPTPYIYRAAVVAHQAMAIMRDPLALSAHSGGVDRLRRQLDEALQYLRTHKQIAADDPHWYALMIIIMRAQGAAIDAIIEVMFEGADRHPDYLPIYFETTRAIGLLSRKPLDDMEALANTAVEKSAHLLGDELYSRVYRLALVEVFPAGIARHLKWNWPKMVASMNTTAERYKAQYNVQMFALFACMMRDRDMTTVMLKETRGNPIPEIWGDAESYGACEAWAGNEAPPKGPKTYRARNLR